MSLCNACSIVSVGFKLTAFSQSTELSSHNYFFVLPSYFTR